MSGDEDSNAVLNLEVLDQDGRKLQFQVKKNTPLQKLMNAYCTHFNVDQGMTRFFFDGNRITKTDTPNSMEMEDGDAIDVMADQQGGENTSEPHS